MEQLNLTYVMQKLEIYHHWSRYLKSERWMTPKIDLSI